MRVNFLRSTQGELPETPVRDAQFPPSLSTECGLVLVPPCTSDPNQEASCLLLGGLHTYAEVNDVLRPERTLCDWILKACSVL